MILSQRQYFKLGRDDSFSDHRGNMVTEFQNNFDTYNEGLTKKIADFQIWVEETLDYEMTIDAQNVIATIQSSVFISSVVA